jgi:hypothetical protein
VNRRVRLLFITLSLAAAFALCFMLWLSNDVYRGSEESIETYLRTQTPLGSSQQQVTQWLSARGVGSEVFEAIVEPNSDYPPTKIGGTSFIHESVAHYGLIFRADIEAFYIFDSQGTLVDLRVRRTVDAL